MKFIISYFAQIRNMTQNILPLSTAVWPPKWWEKHFDKNNVLNGLECSDLVPGYDCRDLCRGPEPEKRVCNGDPKSCNFLKIYRDQLEKIDFKTFKQSLEDIVQVVNKTFSTDIDTICFIVFEKYDNLCSERWMIKDWWMEKTGEELEEFRR